MDINLSQCFIAVDDHDKALAFYRDVLGLQVRTRPVRGPRMGDGAAPDRAGTEKRRQPAGP